MIGVDPPSPWSPEIEICIGSIWSVVTAAEIARGCADAHSIISVGIPVFDSQKKFKGGHCPLGVGVLTPEIFLVV